MCVEDSVMGLFPMMFPMEFPVTFPMTFLRSFPNHVPNVSVPNDKVPKVPYSVLHHVPILRNHSP
jgi:hypothetical protein